VEEGIRKSLKRKSTGEKVERERCTRDSRTKDTIVNCLSFFCIGSVNGGSLSFRAAKMR
jgi:hypothetical protein